MTAQQTEALIRLLVTSVADWQRSASMGRNHQTSITKATKAAARLFKELTGQEPSTEQLGKILSSVGLV